MLFVDCSVSHKLEYNYAHLQRAIVIKGSCACGVADCLLQYPKAAGLRELGQQSRLALKLVADLDIANRS